MKFTLEKNTSGTNPIINDKPTITFAGSRRQPIRPENKHTRFASLRGGLVASQLFNRNTPKVDTLHVQTGSLNADVVENTDVFKKVETLERLVAEKDAKIAELQLNHIAELQKLLEREAKLKQIIEFKDAELLKCKETLSHMKGSQVTVKSEECTQSIIEKQNPIPMILFSAELERLHILKSELINDLREQNQRLSSAEERNTVLMEQNVRLKEQSEVHRKEMNLSNHQARKSIDSDMSKSISPQDQEIRMKLVLLGIGFEASSSRIEETHAVAEHYQTIAKEKEMEAFKLRTEILERDKVAAALKSELDELKVRQRFY
eukprot:TRINITY_DN5067_c0_g2_i11.p2 TRINITY_DN5067_c0_g2~~TRINITY_DN5067_c0_g2_i11.p2  ORF type:complete len:319 (+),score=68.30 TRINITY_DN5067_c0_g2_i11:1510-2466(+)